MICFNKKNAHRSRRSKKKIGITKTNVMNKIEINAVVNAFLIECINNDDVGTIDCFKGIDNMLFWRSFSGSYKGLENVFYVRIHMHKENEVKIDINTESKEALEFINSFNIISNE